MFAETPSKKLATTKDHCTYCFDIVINALDGKLKKGDFPKLPESIPKVSAPLFVTWHIFKDELRGCIGTFASESIEKNLPRYAMISAFQDTRFDPISKDELKNLSCAVSLLTEFENGKDAYDWEVGTHGIQIEFEDSKGSSYHATFLPEVASEQGWDKEETLKHLVRKSGYHGALKNVISAIKVERYQSSKVEITYGEYLEIKKKYIG